MISRIFHCENFPVYGNNFAHATAIKPSLIMSKLYDLYMHAFHFLLEKINDKSHIIVIQAIRKLVNDGYQLFVLVSSATDCSYCY